MPTDITEAIRAIDFEALVFDMDGVFVDSEPIFFEAFNIILAPYGVGISDDYFCQMVGYSSEKNLADIARDWDIDLPVESSLRKLDEAYMNLVKARAISARSGVWPLISRAKAAGLRLGLCTSSPDHLARLVVGKILDHDQPGMAFEELFDAVITGDRVDHKKPHPEPYEKLASLLDISPAYCLVIEDSNSGVASAKAAGSTCVALRDVYNRRQDFSQADLVIHDLGELKISTD
ncbi:MAG: HAD family phosphatase [Fidelibacterota bacterium]|nr:MAG: HAD family phosphatase [Candidatus Neomarinimicrobiota bacterium]